MKVYNNKKTKAKIMFLYYDPHYFHAALARALHAGFLSYSKAKVGEKQFYIEFIYFNGVTI